MARLDVQESGAKKLSLENPGAGELMASLGGARSGVPYYAILNEEGKKIADSNAMPGGGNIGYPAIPTEILAFRNLLKRTAPRLTDDELVPLAAYLQRPVERGR